MAGSLNHITDDDGAFTMDTIENMRDAHQALEECFDIIALLLTHSGITIADFKKLCNKAKAPLPKAYPMFGKRAGSE